MTLFTSEDPVAAVVEAARQLAVQDRRLHRDRGTLDELCSALTRAGDAIPAALLTRQRRVQADLTALGAHRKQLLAQLSELRRSWLDTIGQIRKGPRAWPNRADHDHRSAVASAQQREQLLLEALRLLDGS